MSEDEPSLRRPLLFVSTAVYLSALAVAAVAVFVGVEADALLQYGGVGALLSLPVSWWITGRESGFDGFDPGNLAFLVGIGIVAAVGFPVVSSVGLDDSVVVFLGLVVAAIVVGRLLERFVERRFGEHWGADGRSDDPDVLDAKANDVLDDDSNSDATGRDTGTADDEHGD